MLSPNYCILLLKFSSLLVHQMRSFWIVEWIISFLYSLNRPSTKYYNLFQSSSFIGSPWHDTLLPTISTKKRALTEWLIKIFSMLTPSLFYLIKKIGENLLGALQSKNLWDSVNILPW